MSILAFVFSIYGNHKSSSSHIHWNPEKGVTFAFCHFCYFCVLCSPYLLVLSVWLTLVQAEQQDVGRAKAKISVEEMLKLHRKRRDDDKLFSINSPRKNEAKQVRNKILKFHPKIVKVFSIETRDKVTKWRLQVNKVQVELENYVKMVKIRNWNFAYKFLKFFA